MEAQIPENIKAYVQPLIQRIAALEQQNKALREEVAKINSQLSGGNKTVGKAHMTTTVKPATTSNGPNKPLKTHGNEQGSQAEKKISSVKSATKLPIKIPGSKPQQVQHKKQETKTTENVKKTPTGPPKHSAGKKQQTKKQQAEGQHKQQKQGVKKAQPTPRPAKKVTENKAPQHKQEKKPTTAADKTRHATTKKTGKGTEKSPATEKHEETKHQQTKKQEVSDSTKQFQSDLKKQGDPQVVQLLQVPPPQQLEKKEQVQAKTQQTQVKQEQASQKPVEQQATAESS